MLGMQCMAWEKGCHRPCFTNMLLSSRPAPSLGWPCTCQLALSTGSPALKDYPPLEFHPCQPWPCWSLPTFHPANLLSPGSSTSTNSDHGLHLLGDPQSRCGLLVPKNFEMVSLASRGGGNEQRWLTLTVMQLETMRAGT